jgi:hypothetical protein
LQSVLNASSYFFDQGILLSTNGNVEVLTFAVAYGIEYADFLSVILVGGGISPSCSQAFGYFSVYALFQAVFIDSQLHGYVKI